MTANLDAIGRPVTPTDPTDDERFAAHQSIIDDLTETVAKRCMLSSDPHRALAGAIGRLAQVQLHIRRGKGRPSAEQEQAVAGPHRAKKARKK